MRIGAHVSAAGGIDKAIDRAQALGAETVQIFASSPRGWAFKPLPEQQAIAFKEKAKAAGIQPVFLHGIYLVNLGGTEELVKKSVESLTNHMNVAGQIGASGVIFHSGSHKGLGFDGVFSQVVKSLTHVLDNSPDETWLIIENCAGMGDQIGASFKDIGKVIKSISSPRVKVCLDTEHAFAAGYNIADPQGINSAMDEFDREIGLDRLVAVHANDAKVALGSGVDRHENIGDGYIGVKGFEVIMSNPAFRSVPFLLEVPGPDGSGPDKDNVDRLKAIRQRLGIKP